jgi:hypothetical protein
LFVFGLFWRKSRGRPWTQFFSNGWSDCKSACRSMVNMLNELKERNILKLILIVRFACAKVTRDSLYVSRFAAFKPARSCGSTIGPRVAADSGGVAYFSRKRREHSESPKGIFVRSRTRTQETMFHFVCFSPLHPDSCRLFSISDSWLLGAARSNEHVLVAMFLCTWFHDKSWRLDYSWNGEKVESPATRSIWLENVIYVGLNRKLLSNRSLTCIAINIINARPDDSSLVTMEINRGTQYVLMSPFCSFFRAEPLNTWSSTQEKK